MGTLTPDARRGGLVGAAAVALTLTVAVLNFRFQGEWGRGIHLVYSAAASFFVVVLAVNGPKSESKPAPWHSILFITGFALTGAALVRVADILGSHGGSGTYVWIGLMLIALTSSFATRFDSGISTLLGALTAIVVVIALIDLVFHPSSGTTYRWVLLVLALAFGAGAVARGGEPGHATGYANAAGVALLGIAYTLSDSLFVVFGDPDVSVNAGAGWKLVLLLGATALAIYSVAQRRSGPGYLAAVNFAVFIGLAAGPGKDGASLIGWPIVLVLATAGLIAAATMGGASAED